MESMLLSSPALIIKHLASLYVGNVRQLAVNPTGVLAGTFSSSALSPNIILDTSEALNFLFP